MAGTMLTADGPLILFGAFDRHNFGDLLLGEVARALVAPRPVVFAGLAERDLSAQGGRPVQAIASLAAAWGAHPARILHVGGELLTCSLYEAAVMLQTEAAAASAIARYDTDPQAAHAWAVQETRLDRPVAYQVPPGLFWRSHFVAYLGVGGVGLDRLPDSIQASVVAPLAQADCLWVRDRLTCRHLANHGLAPVLAPDPAELTAALFRSVIRAHGARNGELQEIRQRFPAGYLAVQFSADYGDDATLAAIGEALRSIQAKRGAVVVPGIVLFRAGSAPWHDRLDVYRRLLALTPCLAAAVFESLHVWDIGALLAGSAGYVGSSLHGRIVAESFGRPAVSLVCDDPAASKVGAYVLTWCPDAAASIATVEMLAEAVSVFRQTPAQTIPCGRQQRTQAAARARLAWSAARRCLRKLPSA